VDADPDLLRSAVENVVRNATRYTAEGTTVEVRLERQPAANGDGEEIIVRVLDSGPGVPDEALPKIFEPFYRWTMPATARPGARVWACRSRIGPSGCTAGNFAHPTAKRVG
jgi:signal transduction histidine kinase